jgi:UDP-N-acetylmuramoyl-tripeptide--D-alanyl-D-alanine ligase
MRRNHAQEWGEIMATFSMKEIANIVGGNLISGDGNRCIDKFSTNSKIGDETTLFVPIIGERVDAHDFIGDAYRNGIRCTFTSRDRVEEDTKEMTYLQVDSPVAALQCLGTYYRDQFQLPIVGITGSVGKTTTKEMVAAALETKLCVLKTEGNMNSQVGLPQMMTRIDQIHEIAVIEMGMSQFGEMERLATIAKPEFAVMTNIGVSHIGQLKTMENIRSEKANICNYFEDGSTLLLNGDDKMLREIADAFVDDEISENEKILRIAKLNLSKVSKEKLLKANILTFGTDQGCSVYADSIRTVGNSTFFSYHYLSCEGSNEVEEIELSVLGKHNILNALVALYVASSYGITPSIAKEGLKLYQPISMRGGVELVKEVTWIDDTYNASPDSMKGAINILLELPKENKKIIVFADILELGDISQQCHYEVGEYLAKNASLNLQENDSIDMVVTIGSQAAYIAYAVKNNNPAIDTYSFENQEEATDFLLQQLQKKDAILFKGSRSMQLEVLVQQLKVAVQT